MNLTKEFAKLVDLETCPTCVILTVRKDCPPISLIRLGCFDGDETMIRLAKDSEQTITIFTKTGHWSWGANTMCAESMSQQRRIIQDYVKDLGLL